MKFTRKTLDKFCEREEWGGYGFLGTVEELPKKFRAKAENAVCRAATELGLSEDMFFEWCNSRPGRHWADWACEDRTPEALQKSAKENMEYMLSEIKAGKWY